MSGFGRTSLSSLLDLGWRTAFRLGYPLARIWWQLARPRHEGAVVAVYVGPALLLVRSSYGFGWHLPGGGVRRGEIPEAAAQRELAEEIGLVTSALLPAGVACGRWDGRLDNREIIEARLTSPSELHSMVLSGPVAAYLGRSPAAGCDPGPA